MNPPHKNHNHLNYQILTEYEKRVFATSFVNACDNHPELAMIIQAWSELDEKSRKAIMALVS